MDVFVHLSHKKIDQFLLLLPFPSFILSFQRSSFRLNSGDKHGSDCFWDSRLSEGASKVKYKNVRGHPCINNTTLIRIQITNTSLGI